MYTPDQGRIKFHTKERNLECPLSGQSYTFDVQNDDLALDRVGVDRAAVFALVQRMNIAHLQVPFLDVRSYHAESRVVDDTSFLVSQRDGMVVQPRYLFSHVARPFDNIT